MTIKDLNTLSNNSTPEIPAPKVQIIKRYGLPILIISICIILLAWAARDTIIPATAVTITQAIARPASETNNDSISNTVTVQAPGWVEPDPYPIYVPALASGVVKEILALEGQQITQNQIVAKLIDDDARYALQKSQAQLQQKQAQLAIAQAKLQTAQTNWDHPIEQDRQVSLNQARLQEAQIKLLQNHANLLYQQANLAEIHDQYQRLKNLGPASVPQNQITQTGFKYDAQKAMITVSEKQIAASETLIDQIKADLTAAIAHRKLRIAETNALAIAKADIQMITAEIANAQATVNEAQLRLDRMQVRSPANGIVMKRLAAVGSKVMLQGDMKTSADIVHLYDPQKLQIRVDVPLSQAALIGLNQKAQITLDILPDKTFTGHLTRIVHEADIQKNTLEVKVAIENPDQQIKPEMLARVKFLAPDKSDISQPQDSTSLFVSENAIVDKQENIATVWLNINNRAIKQQITLGSARIENYQQVIQGINPGDKIIANPTALTENQRIKTINTGI